ncbi:MAG: AzlC family ABC transporter permease, partial [Kineosporiaceae bacterium]
MPSPFGVALGMTAASLDVNRLATVLGAGLIYGGSAQLTVTTLISTGTLLSAVGSGVLVNSRLLLYGASLESRFRRQTLTFRLLAPHFVIDQTYLAASARPDLDDTRFRRYWLRLGWGLFAAWTAAVALGVLIGPSLPPMPHLGLVPYAMFIAMLARRLTNVPAAGAALAGGAATLVGLMAAPRRSGRCRRRSRHGLPARPPDHPGSRREGLVNDVLALSLVALASWLLRIGLIVIVPVSRLPGTLRSSLDHLAPAVLASIVTVDLSHTVPAAPGTTMVVA